MGMGFQFEQHRLGLWDLSWDLKRKETICWEMGSGPPAPSGPSVEKQKQQMIKLRNLGGAEKLFFLSQDEQIG